MNYPAFTNESLTMMYAAVRGALVADDSVERQGGEPKFKVRDTSEWKKHAADLETEMLRRGTAMSATSRRCPVYFRIIQPRSSATPAPSAS
jgi:hypothetical protein